MKLHWGRLSAEGFRRLRAAGARHRRRGGSVGAAYFVAVIGLGLSEGATHLTAEGKGC